MRALKVPDCYLLRAPPTPGFLMDTARRPADSYPRPCVLDLAVLGARVEALLEGAGIAGSRVEVLEPSPQVADAALAADVLDLAAAIAREAFSNVSRHAEARHTLVRIGLDSADLHLTIRDDGLGICPARAAANAPTGLLRMRELAASHGGGVHVAAPIEGGTSVRLRLPRTPPQ